MLALTKAFSQRIARGPIKKIRHQRRFGVHRDVPPLGVPGRLFSKTYMRTRLIDRLALCLRIRSENLEARSENVAKSQMIRDVPGGSWKLDARSLKLERPAATGSRLEKCISLNRWHLSGVEIETFSRLDSAGRCSRRGKDAPGRGERSDAVASECLTTVEPLTAPSSPPSCLRQANCVRGSIRGSTNFPFWD